MTTAIQKTLCALAVLSAASLSVFAESIDVKVIGTINPAACTPTLAGGGTIDYGTIKPTTLAKDAYTLLQEKQISFSIVCDAPAAVAIRGVDGRSNTLAGVKQQTYAGNIGEIALPLFGMTAVNMGVVGLGLASNGTAIGGYGIRIDPATVTADGNKVDTISSVNGRSWGKTGVNGTLYATIYDRTNSWAATGTTVPVAFTTLSGQLGVQAYINKASALDLTQPIQLDGLTTLELVYL